MKKTRHSDKNTAVKPEPNEYESNSVDEQFDFTGVTIPATIGNYKLGKSIGYGAFSLVKVCQLISAKTDEKYACKIIPKIRLTDERMRESFEAEIRINQQLHHPGIVQLLELFKDEHNYYIIMEYCSKGDLFTYITENEKIQESEAKYIFKQILEALQYLQSVHISHRDLKPENILFSENNRIKIIDFGLSKFISEKNHNLVQTPCGSPIYASPECISGKPYNGKTTDVWSCGVILYTMLTGHIPWTKHKEDQIFKQISRADYSCPDYVSTEAKLLINGLLTVDFHRRYTVQTALNDGWLADVPKSAEIGTTVGGFVSIRKIDQFFERETNDESLIGALKIRKRFANEPKSEIEEKPQKEGENKKKLSFFQRMKLRKAAKNDQKNKAKKDKDTKSELKEPSHQNSNANNNDSLSDGGLKFSLSSPCLNLCGIQKKPEFFQIKNRGFHSDECGDCTYINLL